MDGCTLVLQPWYVFGRIHGTLLMGLVFPLSYEDWLRLEQGYYFSSGNICLCWVQQYEVMKVEFEKCMFIV